MSDIQIPNKVISITDTIESLKQVSDHTQFIAQLGKHKEIEKNKTAEAKIREKKMAGEISRTYAARRDQRQLPRGTDGKSDQSMDEIGDEQYANWPQLHDKEEGEYQGQKKKRTADDEKDEIGDPEYPLEAEGFAEQIAAMADEDSIFEIALPDGSTVGVVAKLHPIHVDYILDPSNGNLGKKLRQKATQMELKDHLEQRIGKQVSLSVT